MSTPDQPPIGFSICYPDEPFEMHAGPFTLRKAKLVSLAGLEQKTATQTLPGLSTEGH